MIKCSKCGNRIYTGKYTNNISCHCKPIEWRVVEPGSRASEYWQKDHILSLENFIEDKAEAYYSDDPCNPKDFALYFDIKRNDRVQRYKVYAEMDVNFNSVLLEESQ